MLIFLLVLNNGFPFALIALLMYGRVRESSELKKNRIKNVVIINLATLNVNKHSMKFFNPYQIFHLF